MLLSLCFVDSCVKSTQWFITRPKQWNERWIMAPVNIKVKCHSDTNNVEWLIVFSFHEIWCFSDYSRLNLIVIILNYEQELHTVKCTPKFCGIEKNIFVLLFFAIIIEPVWEEREERAKCISEILDSEIILWDDTAWS